MQRIIFAFQRRANVCVCNWFPHVSLTSIRYKWISTRQKIPRYDYPPRVYKRRPIHRCWSLPRSNMPLLPLLPMLHPEYFGTRFLWKLPTSALLPTYLLSGPVINLDCQSSARAWSSVLTITVIFPSRASANGTFPSSPTLIPFLIPFLIPTPSRRILSPLLHPFPLCPILCSCSRIYPPLLHYRLPRSTDHFLLFILPALMFHRNHSSPIRSFLTLLYLDPNFHLPNLRFLPLLNTMMFRLFTMLLRMTLPPSPESAHINKFLL